MHDGLGVPAIDTAASVCGEAIEDGLAEVATGAVDQRQLPLDAQRGAGGRREVDAHVSTLGGVPRVTAGQRMAP